MLTFVNTDPEEMYADMKSQFEEITGRTVYDGQPEAQFLRLMAYRESLTRIDLNRAANMNLVAYSSGEYLDELGRLVDTDRLQAVAAVITLGVTPAAPMVLPAGTVVQSKAAKINFRTMAAVALPAGGADIVFTAMTPGTVGNGLDDVTVLISNISGIASIVVRGPSSGGSDVEVDDRYRQRIEEAPEHYSVAGPRGAYRYYALSASSLIRDVDVLSSSPGNVDIYLLADTDVKPQVAAILSAEDVRPLTDNVVVHDAVECTYSINLTYKIFSTADVLAVGQLVTTAVNAYVATLAAKLGVDIVVSQLVKAVMAVDGVYSVSVSSPAADVVVQAYEVAVHSGVPVITFGGVENG